MKEINETTECWTVARYIRGNGAVIDFSGLYEVSSLGRVRDLRFENKMLTLCSYISKKDGTKFYRVTMYKDGKSYTLLVHRLIMSSFDPTGWAPGYIVNHKVERTLTTCINDLSNLEWATQKDNTNTEHCRAAQSKAHTNHPSLSKRVKVKFSDGTQRIFPSTREVERQLGLPKGVCSASIRGNKGVYKKLNMYFSYENQTS